METSDYIHLRNTVSNLLSTPMILMMVIKVVIVAMDQLWFQVIHSMRSASNKKSNNARNTHLEANQSSQHKEAHRIFLSSPLMLAKSATKAGPRLFTADISSWTSWSRPVVSLRLYRGESKNHRLLGSADTYLYVLLDLPRLIQARTTCRVASFYPVLLIGMWLGTQTLPCFVAFA